MLRTCCCRVAIVLVAGMIWMTLTTGCIAVSAKDISTGYPLDAVAAADGKIYIVDLERGLAAPATIVPSLPERDDD